MPTTFKAVVYADDKKKDGTYNVKIRVTHNRRTLKISTNIYVTAGDLTRGSLNLKNQDDIDKANEIIRRWRKIVSTIDYAADSMDVKQIVEYIKSAEKGSEKFTLNFIEYGRKIAAQKSDGTARTYNTALNSLTRFVKSTSLDISQITSTFLFEFERFLENEPAFRGDPKNRIVQTEKSKAGGRAISLYLANIRHVHNQAKEEFNDEDNGIIKIPLSPFKKYRVKKPPKTKKRAVPQKVVQSFIDLPDMKRINGSVTDLTRQNLARDCFLLSFALAGMNATDLYSCPQQQLNEDERVIIYNRGKTRERRDDEAEMHIRIEPCIWPLIKKYLDPNGERLFSFYKHYSSIDGFNDALRKGLAIIESKIKPNTHITFYSARHTWATLARSKALKIDKYTVHEGLNHVAPEMRITDIYIEKDWELIWDANTKVLKLLDWAPVAARAEDFSQTKTPPIAAEPE